MYLQIKRAAMALFLSLICFVAYAQQTVSGTVKDATGEPMIGVTVLLDGQPAAITDLDGNFTINNAKSSSVIKVTYIGYNDQEITVGNKTSFNITLQEDNQALDEVVVVGYGTMKKSDLTGSISSVNTEQLNAKGASSVMGNLQGSNPGVNITQTSGRSGDNFNIEIRGRSSINSDTTPMFVVDGVICSDINFLNLQDIERIDILKDASSTAIYGSRATAGVVMVTTKGGLSVGKEQKPTISYDGYYGWSKVARMPDFMSGQEFYNYRFLKFLGYAGNQATSGVANPVYQIGGTTLEQCLLREGVGTGDYIMKQMLASGNTYDWPSMVTQDGHQQNHFISVNGGSAMVNYHFGIGYNSENGVYKGDEQNRINFKGSVDAKINKIVSAGFSINGARTKTKYANDDAIKYAYRMNPYMIPYDEDGNLTAKPGSKETLNTTASGYQFSDQANPLLVMMSTSKQRETWRLLGNFYLKFDILKGLDFKTTFSPNYTYYRQGYFEGYKDPENETFYDASLSTTGANITSNRGFSWTWDNIVNYRTTIAKDHNLNLMGLFSMQASNTERIYWVASGVQDRTDWWKLQSGEFNKEDSKTSYSENSMTSYALRANYDYKGRYMLTGTVRWDGSSKFTKGSRWGCFPSVAAAWRISEEAFMQDIKWLNNLKLRLSYGITGNCDGITDYATQQTLASSAVYYPFGGVLNTGNIATDIVNKDLQWETSREWNFGIDYGFLGGRINGTIDLYQKTSKDLLYVVDLPLVSGGGQMTTNIGSVRNRGIELSLNTVNIKTKDWLWETTFTFSHNKNKVLEINGTGDRIIKSAIDESLFIGHSANNLYAFEWGGIVTDRDMVVPNNEATTAAGLTPGTTMKEYDYFYKVYGLTEGQPWIVDQNGDGNIDADDKTIQPIDPKWMGSFTSNLSWKNWDFGFSLYAKIGGKAYSNFLASDILAMNDRGRQKLAMDWYIPAGTLLDCDGVNEDGTYINPVYQTSTHYGDYPFPNNGGSSGGVGRQAEFWNVAKAITSTSFVKVKNITLGYTFDRNLLNKFGCKQLRLYCTVTNPFVFTKYKGFDPEWADASAKNDGPSTVTYQIGASVKF